MQGPNWEHYMRRCSERRFAERRLVLGEGMRNDVMLSDNSQWGLDWSSVMSEL